MPDDRTAAETPPAHPAEPDPVDAPAAAPPPAEAPTAAEPTGGPPSAEEWQRIEAEAEARQAVSARGMEALRREWGAGYDANIGLARRLVNDIGSRELFETIERAGLGEDPHVLRAVAQAARLVYRPERPGAAEQERIRRRLDELHGLQHHGDPVKRTEYRTRRVQDELRSLYGALHGDEPVVGQRRRA